VTVQALLGTVLGTFASQSVRLRPKADMLRSSISTIDSMATRKENAPSLATRASGASWSAWTIRCPHRQTFV
jgi:hypothetical protein